MSVTRGGARIAREGLQEESESSLVTDKVAPATRLCKQVRIHGKGFFWNMRTPNPYDELVHAVSEASPAAGPGPTRCAACSQTTPDMKNVSCVAVHVSHFTA